MVMVSSSVSTLLLTCKTKTLRAIDITRGLQYYRDNSVGVRNTQAKCQQTQRQLLLLLQLLDHGDLPSVLILPQAERQLPLLPARGVRERRGDGEVGPG